jgi:hypothetical protein
MIIDHLRDWRNIAGIHLETRGWNVEPNSKSRVSAFRYCEGEKIKHWVILNCLDLNKDGFPQTLSASFKVVFIEVESYLVNVGASTGVSLIVDLGRQCGDLAFKNGHLRLIQGSHFSEDLDRFLGIVDRSFGDLHKLFSTSAVLAENIKPPIVLPPNNFVTCIHWGLRRLAYYRLADERSACKKVAAEIAGLILDLHSKPEPANAIEANLRQMEIKTAKTVAVVTAKLLEFDR